MRLDTIFTTRDIYIYSKLDPITKFGSSRITQTKDIIPWNITGDQEHHINHHMNNQWNEMEHLFCDNNMIKISQIEKRLADQKLRSEDKNKCKGAKLWESVRLFKNKNYNKVHQVYQVSQNGLTSPYDGH